jgi:hypothetical protein
MPGPDPLAITRWARILAAGYTPDERARLAADPVETVGELHGLHVVLMRRPGRGCDLDASYKRETKTITIDASASLSRRRFSCLHELGHHNSDSNVDLAEWLHATGAQQKYVLERVCDGFAAELLLPDDVVKQHLVQDFGARQVAQLFMASDASREACVVRAADALRAPGLIILADSSGTVLFSSARSLAFRIGRGVAQTESSVIYRAAMNGTAQASGRETVALRSGKACYTEFHGDAFRCPDGYVFGVLRDAGEDVDHRGNPFGGTRVWTCSTCSDDISDEPWCSNCSRRRCPSCGCGCGRSVPSIRTQFCKSCGLAIPLAYSACPDCA